MLWMDYQVKIYVLLGVLLMINIVVFILNNLLRVEVLPEKDGRELQAKGEKKCLVVSVEDIVDVDYYLIEGCVFTYGKERCRNDGFSTKGKKS